MRAEPARLARAGGKFPARIGEVTAGHRLHFMRDRAPGEDAGRHVENLVGRIAVEIGRRHGADRALAKAPRRRGVGLGNFLLHLHEDFERRFGSAQALRQQRAIKSVLDQGGNHRLGQAPRPFDLVSLPRDQRIERPRTFDELETGALAHVFPRRFLFFGWRARNGGLSAAADQDGEAAERGSIEPGYGISMRWLDANQCRCV